MPIITTTARFAGLGTLVDFNEVFASSADDSVRVCDIHRMDTDGDDFNEWVVFYQYDTVAGSSWRQPCPDNSPRNVVIYDTDRGEPAVIFPYTLDLPDRDFLGQQGAYMDQVEIVPNVANTSSAVPELLIYGMNGGTVNQLSIFKYYENTEEWEDPRDGSPKRYQLMGAFMGNGGVSFDEDTFEVTVKNHGPELARSQLAVQSVYKLQDNGSYFVASDNADLGPASANATQLSAPTQSTVDFAYGPPEDLLSSEYPEKIALAFYKSIDRNSDYPWNIEDLFSAQGEAGQNYADGTLQYFGFTGNQAVSNLSVSKLEYYPDVESTSAAVSSFGETPQFSRVDISFAAEQNGTMQEATVSLEMIYFNGLWKINKHIVSQ